MPKHVMMSQPWTKTGDAHMRKREAARCGLRPELADTNHLLRNTVSRKFHWGHLLEHDRLACGKIVSDNYVDIDIYPDLLWPRCRKCFPQPNPALGANNSRPELGASSSSGSVR